MITVLSWFWRQENGRAQYEPLHVNIWAAMVRRNLSMPHRIACVTDMPEGLDPSIEIITPPREFENWRISTWGEDRPQCLRRLSMFAPDAESKFGGRFVCMDLDCVVTGALDPLFDTKSEFKIFAGTGKGRAYNGSMMLLKAGSRPQVYERLTLEDAEQAGRHFIGSDQAWIAYCLGPDEDKWDSKDGVEWWGQYHRPHYENTRLVFFPGHMKPWDFRHPIVRENYRGSDQRKCLILGYGPSIWDDVQSAMKREQFDIVIASPEAAEHWPGNIYAIAKTDREAERIAALSGFDRIVFCGRSEGMAA